MVHRWDIHGELQNPKEVLSRKEYQRYKQAQNTFDKPSKSVLLFESSYRILTSGRNILIII